MTWDWPLDDVHGISIALDCRVSVMAAAAARLAPKLAPSTTASLTGLTLRAATEAAGRIAGLPSGDVERPTNGGSSSDGSSELGPATARDTQSQAV